VHFSAGCIKKEAEEMELVIEVVDTGIGIEESKINFIFEDFTQEEMSTTRKYGGTGLGLSIVKKLIELHNGTIECTSRKNEGTKITCHIPFLTGDEKMIRMDVEPPLNVPEEVRNLKILIVDDEEYNRLLFKTILDRWKVRYHTAINGMEALELLKTERYDLLFMDARMPGIDGLKATEFIRNEMKISKSDMPVICISAATINDDWEKYQKAGMNAFLPKPFTEEMLLTAILSVIRGYNSTSAADVSGEPKNESLGPDKVNLQNLYHISGGDEKFVIQMLLSFIDSTNKGLAELNDTVKSGLFDSAADLAHKMSSPCRHIGAMGLFNLLKKIEENIQKKTDLNNLGSLAEESVVEFEVVCRLIKEHIAKIG
jgi:CheY-like chemotaxis protein/HPt (histidine-containing phosphotransfer) domain-containing protein